MSFTPDQMLKVLPIAGEGLAVTFGVMVIIMAAVYALNRLTSLFHGKKEKDADQESSQS